MTYRLHIEGPRETDDLRSLVAFLAAEPELRGRVELADLPPRPGHLGVVADAIVVAVGSGGALTVLAGTVAAWVQTRGAKIRIRIESATGGVAELDAEHVKSLDATGLRKLLTDVDAALQANDSSA